MTLSDSSHRLLLAVAAAATLGGTHSAFAANLLKNPAFTGASSTTTALVDGYASDVSFSVPDSANPAAPCTSTALANNIHSVSYAYGTESGDTVKYLQVQVTNSSNCTLNYGLTLKATVAEGGGNVPVAAGQRLVFTAALKNMAYDGASGGALAYNLNSSASYLGGASTNYNPYVSDAYQNLKLSYLVGAPVANFVPVSVTPQVSMWNIPAGGTLRFRVKSPSVERTAAATAITLKGLGNRQVMAAPGKKVKLSVDFDLAPTSSFANIPATLELLDANNAVAHTVLTRNLRGNFGQAAGGYGPDIDGWSFTLPSTLPEGVYTIRYGVGLGSILAGPGVTPSGTKFLLGQLVVDANNGIYIGQHFHRYPSPDYDTTQYAAGTVGVTYNFVRTLNSNINVSRQDNLYNNIVNVPGWWKEEDRKVDAVQLNSWANRHAPVGAAAYARWVLITFNGVPKWASSRPNETYVDSSGNPATWMQDGEASPPANFTHYKQMVTDTINAIGADRVMGVECWNEPDDRRISFSKLATLTDLADICKAIHDAAKAVSPAILTFCPQPMDVSYLPTLLAAKTSEPTPQPIHKYCDVIGAHNYHAAGTSPSGAAYTKDRLIDFVGAIRAAAATENIKKAIAITEMGFPDGGDQAADKWLGTKFSARAPAVRGEIVYETLAAAAELGVSFPTLYSYDTGDAPIRAGDFPTGFLGNQTGTTPTNVVTFETSVNTTISNATTHLAQSTVHGLRPIQLTVHILPSRTSVPLGATGNVIKFNIAVVNRGQQTATGAAVSTVPSATRYNSASGNTSGYATSTIVVIDSLTGPTGSSCSSSSPTVNGMTVTQWTCQGFSVPPAGAVTLLAQGRIVPSTPQQNYMDWSNFTYDFFQVATASWSGQVGSPPMVMSPTIVISK